LATFTNKRPEGLHPSVRFILGASIDALFQGTGHPLPPAIILDYSYGVAAYKCWRSRQGEVHSLMRSYSREQAQEASQDKVMEWMKRMDVGGL
jgi:hypothetical protein